MTELMTTRGADTTLSVLFWAREEGRLSDLDTALAVLEKPHHYRAWWEDYLASCALEEAGLDLEPGMAVRDADGDLAVMVDNNAVFAHPDCGCGLRAVATVDWTPTCLECLDGLIEGYRSGGPGPRTGWRAATEAQ